MSLSHFVSFSGVYGVQMIFFGSTGSPAEPAFFSAASICGRGKPASVSTSHCGDI